MCSNKFVLLKHKHGIEDFLRALKPKYAQYDIFKKVDRNMSTKGYRKDNRNDNRLSKSQVYICATNYFVTIDKNFCLCT